MLLGSPLQHCCGCTSLCMLPGGQRLLKPLELAPEQPRNAQRN